MTFKEVLAHIIDWLQQDQRLSCRALKRQFALDDDYLEDLKVELIEVRQVALDQDGKILVWRGAAAAEAPTAPPQHVPLTYTPPHLAEQILTSRSALEGERKQVTVLFADLKGSMELLADRDPEEARQLLDPVLERLMAAVHRYEGTVNQVMGDGIMALFGAPLAHEDHAVRACYAALAMQAAVKQYAAEVQRSHGVPVQIRVGLNTGEVVVRAIGSDLHMDYTAVGQTTHLAARMEQMAMPGSILLTQATLRLAEGYVQVTPLGPVPVKGVAAPIDVFELVGASGIRRRLQATAARGLTRFVGRDTELAALVQALARAGAGHGQVVALVGEAGVGKSRLVYEFVHAHHLQGWRVLESASVSYGKATPYFPVIELLKRYSHVDDSDDPRTIRAKLTGQILTLDETFHDTLPVLLALLDALPADSPFAQLDPPQRRQRTRDALNGCCCARARCSRCCWSVRISTGSTRRRRRSSTAWSRVCPPPACSSWSTTAPSISTAGVARPFTLRYGWTRCPRRADELLQALMGTDSSLAALTPLLIARTEGNPFFLEESVQTLVETQVLGGERGAYRLAQLLASLQMPATVQAVLAARIDRLPPEEKRLLQTAAVIGNEAPLPLLQAIAELPEAGLHGSLAHLQAAEFLYETRLFPEREYTFKHALTHEVAYGSLLQEQRRVLHAHIVEAIEALAGDRVAEQVERLASHALRGEMWDKALVYCQQAGEKSLGRSAHREAVGYFEQALSALPHLPETRDTREQAIDLRLALRSALSPSGNFERILVYLHEAEAFAVAIDDPRRLGQVSRFLSAHFYLMGAHDQTIAAAQRTLALATASGDVVLHALANYFLGIAYQAQGDYRRAIDCCGQIVASFEGVRRRERFGQVFLPAVSSRAWLTVCHAELGMFAEGRAVGEEGLRIAEAVAHPASLMIVSWGIGLLTLRQGNLPGTLPLLEQAMGICQEADLPFYFPWMAAALGSTYNLSGHAADAVLLLTQAMEQTMAVETVTYQALCGLSLGDAYMLDGRLEEAHAHTERTLAHAREHQERGNEAYALRLLGDIAAHRDPPESEQAEAHYRQALVLAEELGMRPLVAHCHRGLGMLYLKLGMGAQARPELSAAIDLYRAMDMTFWLPQTEAALAQMEGR